MTTIVDLWEESPWIVEWIEEGMSWIREAILEDKFVVVEVAIIVGWDLVCWEDNMTQEDFLLKEGFEYHKFWTLEGLNFERFLLAMKEILN